MSWALYIILTIDIEIFDISSDEPFAHDFKTAFMSKRVFPSLKRLLFGQKKYITGTTPPTTWLAAVAAAAPAIPHLNSATKSASQTIFIIPDTTVITSPSWGFSAATKKLWKRNCSINAGSVARIILPYSTQ